MSGCNHCSPDCIFDLRLVEWADLNGGYTFQGEHLSQPL
jgi:hypothetical protein